MKEKKPPAKTTVAFVATPSKEHHTLASTCLATATLFFHSKVQGLQDTVSLLLICQSPHSSAFVNSRAVDVHRSLFLGVGMQVFSHVYMYLHFKLSWSWTPHYLCAFSWFGSIACIIKKTGSKVTVKWSLLFFWFNVCKSEVIPLKGSIYTVDFLPVLISGCISKCQSAQLLKIMRKLPGREKVCNVLPLPPSSVLPEQMWLLLDLLYWMAKLWK